MRAIVSSVLLLASGTAAAGVVLEMTTKDLENPESKADTQKLSFQDGQFRVDSLENGRLDATVIYRKGTLYSVDYEGKSYTEIDKATLDRSANQMAAMRKKMQSEMQSMPPEQRAMIEKMMKERGLPGMTGTPPPKPDRAVKETGRTDSAGGRTCRIWEVAVDGAVSQELCVVAPDSLPGGAELMKAMREMAALSRDFMEQVGAGAGPAGDAWSDLEKVKGVPILTRGFVDGKAVDETRLTGIREESVGATAFDVPKGFKQQKIMVPGS
jgi:hypothetical protein